MAARPESPFRILGVVGSLRQGSFNRGLLEAAIAAAPDGVQIEEGAIDDLPFYNADLDIEGRTPEPVIRWREELRAADALLVATPEYNHGIPAPIKNAIDWGSRPVRAEAPMYEKPVGLMGASTGVAGTARAQEQLLLVLLAAGAHPMAGPMILVNSGRGRFQEGRLTDEGVRERLPGFLARLQTWAGRFPRSTDAG